MTVAAEALLRTALELSAAERVEIADALFASLDSRDEQAEIERAWRHEIAARMSSLDAGTAELTPWEEIREGLESRLRAQQNR